VSRDWLSHNSVTVIDPSIAGISPSTGDSQSAVSPRPQYAHCFEASYVAPKWRDVDCFMHNKTIASIQQQLQNFDLDALASRRGDKLHAFHRSYPIVMQLPRRHYLPEGVGVFPVDRIEPSEPQIPQNPLNLG
jgi:hypothetical protein